MMEMTFPEPVRDLRTTLCYQLKRWYLITACALSILTQLILAIMASKMIDSFKDVYMSRTQNPWENIRSVALPVMYGMSFLTFQFDMMGLMGAYTEHYCMTVTYACFRTVVSLTYSIVTLDIIGHWNLLINIIVVILAWVFTYMMYLRRLLLSDTPTPV